MHLVRSSTFAKNSLWAISKNSICSLNRSDCSFPAVEYTRRSRHCYSSCSSNFFHDRRTRYVGRRDVLERLFRSTAIAGKKKNLYDILGVSKSASKDEIKSKYREMAKKCHPDLNRDDKNAEGKFKEIASAYEVLENDSRRQIYDRMETLGIDYEHYEEPTQNYGRKGNGSQNVDFGGFGFQDGDDFFSMFHDMAERDNGKKGKDVNIKLKLSFLEAVHGCTKEVQYEIGSTSQRNKRGKIKTESKTKTVDVKIPAGVDTGMTVQMDGQGCPAKKGNNVGNLVIELLVEKDKYFRREKSDVYTDLHISIDQAILGAFADVRTLDGAVTMKINAGTQPGNTFSISGKGISKVNSSTTKRGNHYVQVKVTIPTVISDRQRELLLEFVKEGALERGEAQSDCQENG